MSMKWPTWSTMTYPLNLKIMCIESGELGERAQVGNQRLLQPQEIEPSSAKLNVLWENPSLLNIEMGLVLKDLRADPATQQIGDATEIGAIELVN